MSNPFHVLAIDDDPSILKLVERTLGAVGYQVSTASSGKIGLEVLKQKAFDLILLDLLMPDMDGIQFLESFPPESEQSVIILSAQDDISTKLVTFERGAVDYITKPFSPAVLVARVEAKLRRV